MEKVNCNLCGADSAPVFSQGRDRLLGIPGHFQLVRCERCRLVYLNPRPTVDEIGAYYPAHYHPYLPAIQDETFWFRRLDRGFGVHKRCRAVMRRVGPTGRMLDVGCATGVFLDGMRRRGWQVQGVELNREVAAYARRRMGLDVFAGSLEEAQFPAECFDLVTLWDVLEHVYDPKATLVECARILRPGGWLLLSLPDLDCVEARIFGRYWAGLDMPRHLHLFSMGVLERLLSETGFSLVERSHFTGRYGALVLSIQFWADERITSAPARRALLGLARSLPVRLLTLPYYSIADRLHQSSIVTVFARKPANA